MRRSAAWGAAKGEVRVDSRTLAGSREVPERGVDAIERRAIERPGQLDTVLRSAQPRSRGRPQCAGGRGRQNGVVFEPAPMDPREVHELVDSPRHTASIVSGWVLAGLLGVGGLVALVGGAAPSDPCSPGASACGPEPLTALRAGLVLLTLAAVSAIWSLAWLRRDGRYEFQVPPEFAEKPTVTT